MSYVASSVNNILIFTQEPFSGNSIKSLHIPNAKWNQRLKRCPLLVQDSPELLLERNKKSALEVELSLTEQLEQQLVFVLQRFSEGVGVERK